LRVKIESLNRDYTIHDVTGVLRTFIKMIPGGLIPKYLHESYYRLSCLFLMYFSLFYLLLILKTDKNLGEELETLQMLNLLLPPSHYNLLKAALKLGTFITLIEGPKFLHFNYLGATISSYNKENKMCALNIAKVWAPNLFLLDTQVLLSSKSAGITLRNKVIYNYEIYVYTLTRKNTFTK
jgi:hypothetical protein